jgi:hypothetical protein
MSEMLVAEKRWIVNWLIMAATSRLVVGGRAGPVHPLLPMIVDLGADGMSGADETRPAGAGRIGHGKSSLA